MTRRDSRVRRGPGPNGARGGFTLIEAIIAVTIGTAIVLMASGVFMVQSDFYDFLVRQSRVQDNARTVVQFVREVIPTVPDGGVVVASSGRFVVRRPQSLAVACADPGGSDLHAILSNGIESLTEIDAEGVGEYTDGSPPSWNFIDTNVGTLIGSTGLVPAAACFAEGVDTVGHLDDFVELSNINVLTGTTRTVSDVFMIYEEFEVSIGTSSLDTLNSALYHGINGGTLVEFVSGLSSSASFEYRVGTTWSSSVVGGNLANINAIRVNATTLVTAGGESSDANFDLQAIIPVGN